MLLDTTMQTITLHAKLADCFRLTDLQKQGLKKLGLETVSDLLWYFPYRYEDASKSESIRNLSKGERVTLFGKIKNLKTEKGFRSKIPMAKGVLEDDTGKIDLVWFNQPYIAKMIKEEVFVKAEGIVGERDGKFYISNPQVEAVTKVPSGLSDSLFEESSSQVLYPVYKETQGVTSNWIFHTLQKIFKSGVLSQIREYIPSFILERYSLPSLSSALIWVHYPKQKDHYVASRKRFAFEEVFLIQLILQKERKENQKLHSLVLSHTQKNVEEFISRFPFALTNAQQKTIESILTDFKKGSPMARLLEGDVGSGKTAVAATAAFVVTQNRPDGKEYGHLQVAYMAPTEILAEQHFKSFIELFKGLHVPMGLITGSGCKKFPSKVNESEGTTISKNQLLKWVQNGEISILIGTHALIQKKVSFKNLAFVIIDEQHRFGTEQRKKLARKDGLVPHLLSMSATPIPRTLALTIYGDLDLSLLNEMPAGRKKIITEIITGSKRDEMYAKIKTGLEEGRQAYIICPRIDEPDPDKIKALYAKSVKEEALRLKKTIFSKYNIGILHSKMTPKEKEKVMFEFKEKKIDILVATSVVEVGVNVPNATMILIEGAERFGLSQLHQLRGRVIRGNHQAYCFVFTESKTDKTIERLQAFKNAQDGFELAELDLKLRGAGELSGGKQWGITDLGMEAIQNIKMVEAARNEAEKIINTATYLLEFPLLRQKLETLILFHNE